MAWVRFAVFLARSPMRSRSDRLLLDLVFQYIDALVVLDYPVGERRVTPCQCVDGVVELLFHQAAHLGQHGLELREVLVIGLHDVFRHFFSPQPKRPVM
jgi:hypothetical protein